MQVFLSFVKFFFLNYIYILVFLWLMLQVLLVIFIGLELWTIGIENLCWLVSLIITIGKFVQHHKLIPHPLFFQFLYVNVFRSHDFLLSFMLSPHEETEFEWDIYTFWTFPANPVLNPVISLSCKIWVGWGITLWCFFLFDCLPLLCVFGLSIICSIWIFC